MCTQVFSLSRDFCIYILLLGSVKNEPVSAIQHKDKDTLLCCTCSGAVNVLDLRSKQVKVTEHQCGGHLASFWTMSNTDNQSNDLLFVSSSGEVLIKDIRRFDETIERIPTPLCTSRNFESLSIQTGTNKDLCSVSGELTLSSLGKNVSRGYFKIFFPFFSQKIGFEIACKLTLKPGTRL